jgi:dihydroorotate dehydrogenase
MYNLLRSILFLLPAETAHYFSMNVFKVACSIPFLRRMLQQSFAKEHPSLHKKKFGLNFKNPVGLGAGFDKNARYLRELETIGFGFVEIGTVTPKPQAGNDKPRLFRLPTDKALINRMGFNNDGVEAVKQRLKAWKLTNEDKGRNSKPETSNYRFLVGGNIGKNKVTPNEEAWRDYEICFRALHPYVDFFVVNVSSPNTPGLRELQEKDALKKILTHLQGINNQQPIQRPILLKIAPDLTESQIDDVIDLAKEINLDGLVATNTTISREGLITDSAEIEKIGAGGLSGLPVKKKSTDVLRYIHSKTAGTIPVIGSGGIFTGMDAKQKIDAGADLVEVWTGFIYEGPFIVKKICSYLAK